MSRLLPLKAALLISSRVVAQDAGDPCADVIIERFLVRGLTGALSIFDACSFSLTVVRQGVPEEHIICLDMGEVEDTLVARVHGGRKLFDGERWSHYDATSHIIAPEMNAEQEQPGQDTRWEGDGSRRLAQVIRNQQPVKIKLKQDQKGQE